MTTKESKNQKQRMWVTHTESTLNMLFVWSVLIRSMAVFEAPLILQLPCLLHCFEVRCLHDSLSECSVSAKLIQSVNDLPSPHPLSLVPRPCGLGTRLPTHYMLVAKHLSGRQLIMQCSYVVFAYNLNFCLGN